VYNTVSLCVLHIHICFVITHLCRIVTGHSLGDVCIWKMDLEVINGVLVIRYGSRGWRLILYSLRHAKSVYFGLFSVKLFEA
jgi:hypothetical protein